MLLSKHFLFYVNGLYLELYKMFSKKLKRVLTLLKPRGIIKFVADEATGIQKKNSKKLKKVVDKDRVVVII